MNPEELRASVSSPWDEFRDHPGQVAQLKWSLLRDFYRDVVRINGILLIQLSELPEVNNKERKKLMRKIQEGREEEYTSEITRLLYNYLVSAATLADHCRRVVKNYEDTDFYLEYERRVANFSHLPESIFLKDLRNYFTHYKIPSIGLSIEDSRSDIDADFRNEALIYTSDLDDSTKWSTISKKYMNDHFPYVYIAGLIKTHLDGLAELYSWIFSNFMELHGDEYRRSLLVRERIMKSV